MSASKRTRETYQDLEEAAMIERGPYMESRKSKVTRVARIYGLFQNLSKLEKENFINLLKNNKF